MVDVLRRAVLERAYDPNQPRRADGKWGRGGGRGGGSTAAPTEDLEGVSGATAALNAIGIQTTADDVRAIDYRLRPEVVGAFRDLDTQQPGLFAAMTPRLQVKALGDPTTYAETVIQNVGDVTPSGFREGYSNISLSSYWFGDKDRLDKDLARDFKDGWAGGETPRTVIAHEVGHVFDSSRGGFYGLEASTDVSPTGWGHAANLSPATTAYGKTSTEERFAEEFAMVSTGRDPGNASGEVMKRLVKGR